MNTGSEVGALLVDGLGDGVAVACPSQDLAFLRNMSFGVLQGSRMRNTKTGQAPIKAACTLCACAELGGTAGSVFMPRAFGVMRHINLLALDISSLWSTDRCSLQEGGVYMYTKGAGGGGGSYDWNVAGLWGCVCNVETGAPARRL